MNIPDTYTFTDLNNNTITTTDPVQVIANMWAKFWPVPPIGKCNKLFDSMAMGEEILLEDTGVIVRKHYKIV